VREQRGLAYTVYSFSTYFADTGMFGVYAGSNPDKVHQVRELVLAEIAKVAAEGVTEAELRRGQGMAKGGMVLAMEDSGSRMNGLGREELLYGDHWSLEQEIADIEAVTVEQIRAVAAEILSQPMTTVAVGPFDQKEFA
jgi:predicted Zn-dependent peptidase